MSQCMGHTLVLQHLEVQNVTDYETNASEIVILLEFDGFKKVLATDSILSSKNLLTQPNIGNFLDSIPLHPSNKEHKTKCEKL